MSKKVGEVYETRDYNIFQLMGGNRLLRPERVRSIKKSIEKYGQQQPIIINEHYAVADGQHRLEALKQSSKPVKYIINPGISVEVVSEINNKTSKWTPLDFANSYAYSGNIAYQNYITFRETYPMFSHTTTLTLLVESGERSQTLEKNFLEGNLENFKWLHVKKRAEMLLVMSKYYDGYNRRSFIQAVLSISNHPEFSLERLIRKLEVKANLILNFSRTEDFIKVLEQIYNWKETNKVRFY